MQHHIVDVGCWKSKFFILDLLFLLYNKKSKPQPTSPCYLSNHSLLLLVVKLITRFSPRAIAAVL